MMDPQIGDPIHIDTDEEGDHLWDEISAVLPKCKDGWLVYGAIGGPMMIHLEKREVDEHPQWDRRDWNEPTRTQLLENP